MNDYLDILILESGQPSHAVAYARYDSDSAVELLPCGLLSGLAAFRDRLSMVANGTAGTQLTKQDISAFGIDIFNFIFINKLLEIYNRLPKEKVRIQVLSNKADFQCLPWEYLQDPKSIKGPNKNRGVVRVIPTIGSVLPVARKLNDKIRLLFVYADPTDQPGVEWQDIKDSIENEFRVRQEEGTFTINVIEAASIEDLNDHLIKYNYDILHFNGHGLIAQSGPNAGVGCLVFRNNTTGKTQEVPASKFAMVVNDRNFRLVVLSACNSSSGDFSKSYAVVAQALVESGVPAVVANQFAVTNSVAATFARGLYQGLLATGDIDEAVSEGRQVLALADYTTLEWGIPTLYRHVGAAKIFEI